MPTNFNFSSLSAWPGRKHLSTNPAWLPRISGTWNSVRERCQPLDHRTPLLDSGSKKELQQVNKKYECNENEVNLSVRLVLYLDMIQNQYFVSACKVTSVNFSDRQSTAITIGGKVRHPHDLQTRRRIMSPMSMRILCADSPRHIDVDYKAIEWRKSNKDAKSLKYNKISRSDCSPALY